MSRLRAIELKPKLESCKYEIDKGTYKSLPEEDLTFKEDYMDVFQNAHDSITETLKDLGRRRPVFLNLIGKVAITQSWVVLNKPKFSYVEQSHPNSIFTGVIFLDDWVEGFGKLNIKVSDKGIWAPSFLDIKEKQVSVGMRDAGGMILFPSHLKVSIEENLSDKDQSFIFFNTFINGSFGNANNKNLLTVQTLGLKNNDSQVQEDTLQDSQMILDLSGEENVY
jgi:hypothetical protein